MPTSPRRQIGSLIAGMAVLFGASTFAEAGTAFSSMPSARRMLPSVGWASRLSSHKAALVSVPSKSTPPVKSSIPTAADVYNRSLTAENLYSYQGHQVTTYWRTGRTIRVLVRHMAPNRRRIDYLAPDSLRGDILVSNGGQDLRYDASRKSLIRHAAATGKLSNSEIPVKYEQLRANYILSFLPSTEMYANRKTFVLSIVRKRNRTLARKLWIDAATGLVLKREAYSETGKLNVTVAYTDINFHPRLTQAAFIIRAPQSTTKISSRAADLRDRTEKPIPVGTAVKTLGGRAFAPSRIDEFRLTSAAIVTRAGKRDALHLRYTDGLVLISVFEQARTQNRLPTRVPASMRAVTIGKTMGHMAKHASLVTLNFDTPTLNVTVMGEMSTARMIDLAEDFGEQVTASAPK